MNEYLKELAYYLRNLRVDDKTDSINYYREYFEDGGFNSYQDCVEELGTPRYLSRKILVDLSINDESHVNKNHHVSNVKTTWLIILAILASPFALIVSLPILAVLIAIIVTVAALVFALVAVIATIGITAFVTLPIAIWAIFTNFAVGMVTLGLDLLIIGFMLVLIPATYWIATGAAKGIKELSTWIYQKTIKRNQHRGGSKK